MENRFYFKPDLVRSMTLIEHKTKNKGYSNKPHKHHILSYELIYVDYGNMELTIGNISYSLGNGQCFIIPGGTKHVLSGKNNEPFDFMNIMFRGRVPDTICNKILMVDKELYQLMQKITDEEKYKVLIYQESICCLLTLFLIGLTRSESGLLPQTPIQPLYLDNYTSGKVRKVLNLIAENYKSPLSVEIAASAIGICPSGFHALIKRETGMTFIELLHKQRIEVAMFMLRKGTLLPSQLASVVGYSSNSYFFRLFRKMTGMSPQEYAKSLGIPDPKK